MNELKTDSMAMTCLMMLSQMSHYQIDSSYLVLDVFQFSTFCNKDF